MKLKDLLKDFEFYGKIIVKAITLIMAISK